VQSEQEQQNALGIQREVTIDKYLNLGCGRIILPASRPIHHALVPEGIYSFPEWENIDRNKADGVDQVFDLFCYPWPLKSNSYGAALLSHLVEHCPHEIKTRIIPPYDWDGDFDWSKRVSELENMQDSWYCLFAELYRVLKPGAMVHILSPYGWSDGAITDPTHTRYVTERTFTHSMQPDPDSPFEYATGGINFRMEAHSFGLTPYFAHLAPLPYDSPATLSNKNTLLTEALATHLNVVSDIYVKLECIK